MNSTKHKHRAISERIIPGSVARLDWHRVASDKQGDAGSIAAAQAATRRTCRCGATRDVVTGLPSSWVND